MQVALVHMLVHVRHATLYKLLFPLMQKSCNLAAGSILEKNQIDDRASRFSLRRARHRHFLLAALGLRKSITLIDRYHFELLIQDLRFTENRPLLRPR